MQLQHVMQYTALMARLSRRKLAAARERQLLVLPLGSHTQLWVVLNGAPSSSGTLLPTLCPAMGEGILARTGWLVLNPGIKAW